jgi:hypothetical protein
VLIEELHGLIDRLSAVDPASLDDADRHGFLVGVQRERSRLGVVAADAMPAWEAGGTWAADGTLRAGLALGRETRSDHTTASRELGRARKLAHMPLVRAAVLEGTLSMDHVDLLCRYATPTRWAAFQRDEALLVTQLAALSLFDHARRTVQYWANRVDDELDLAPPTRPASTLYASRSHDTGESELTGHLAPVDAEIVHGELDRLTRAIHLEDRAAGITRTPAQRRAVALVRMATRSAAADGPTPRPLFQVIVGDDTARHLCQLASGVVLTPHDLAPHTATALIETFLFDGPSTVISVSKRRTFTGALRRAIHVRDRHCQHDSGCPTPAIHCDIDHRQPAARGGPTSQFNGEAKCPPHNRHAHLHDHPRPTPERPLTYLDQWRARYRWHLTHHPHDDDLE